MLEVHQQAAGRMIDVVEAGKIASSTAVFDKGSPSNTGKQFNITTNQLT
jgi:hypothetical protein